MKRIKKLCSLFLAMMMVIAMAVPAMAAQMVDSGKNGNATITVSNATIGETYAVYKVFDATVGDNGEINYIKADLEENDYFAADAAGNITAKEAAFAEDSTDKLSAGAIEWIKNNGTPVIVDAEATESELVFTKLEYGYYYITSTLNDGAAITVTSTKPNAAIIDKNQGGPHWNPEDAKKVVSVNGETVTGTQKISANYGDVIGFQVELATTNYDGEDKITEYCLTDTLAAGMTYVNNDETQKVDVTVKVGDETLAGTAYTIDQKNDGFTLTIDWSDENGGFKYASPNTITVTYEAQVTNSAAVAGDGNTNTAKFSYKTVGSDDPVEPSTNTSTATTYTYALAIKKIDPKGNALTGAKFTVKLGEEQIYVKATEIAGIYEYCDDLDDNGNHVGITEVVSPETGVIIIKGVKAGSYTISETEAPAGYNKLTEAVSISAEIESTSKYTTTITTYYDKDGNVVATEQTDGKVETETVPVNVVAAQVINHAGTVLPSTGGMGTRLFYLAGGILVVAAGVLLVSRKRMEREN